MKDNTPQYTLKLTSRWHQSKVSARLAIGVLASVLELSASAGPLTPPHPNVAQKPLLSTNMMPAPVAVSTATLPVQINTPPLIAAGTGRLPTQITTPALVAVGTGRLPTQITTPALVAVGTGKLPTQITTPALVAVGTGKSSAQVTTPAQAVVTPSPAKPNSIPIQKPLLITPPRPMH